MISNERSKEVRLALANLSKTAPFPIKELHVMQLIHELRIFLI